MSERGNESADHAENKRDETSPDEGKYDEDNRGVGAHATEKPEPDEDDKKEAERMMTAYEDRPTLIMPGSGKTITGTAVNDWLDDDGNSKYAKDQDSPAARAKENAEGAPGTDERAAAESAKQDDAPKDYSGRDESPKDEGNSGKRGYQSERSRAADETAEDKSVEQLNKEAQEAVEENLVKDKAYNEEVIRLAKEKDDYQAQDKDGDKDKAGTSS